MFVKHESLRIDVFVVAIAIELLAYRVTINNWACRPDETVQPNKIS